MFWTLVQAEEPVQTQTYYITDVVYVPLRAGPGNHYRILHRGLKTGVKVSLVEANAGEGYSKIKTFDGLEGFIQQQYLVAKELAKDRLPKALFHIQRLTQENAKLNTALTERDNELKNLKNRLKNISEQLDEKTSEFISLQEATADPQVLDRRNKRLMEENLQLKNRIGMVETENNQLVRSNNMRWYLYGGGTIIIGILFGLFLPLVRFKKKPSSDWI